jgi:hypothetical protein
MRTLKTYVPRTYDSRISVCADNWAYIGKYVVYNE